MAHSDSTARITALVLSLLLVAASGGMLLVSAHSTSSITAGNTSTNEADITVTDASSETSDGSYAVHIDVHNTLSSNDVTVTQIEWQDTDSTNTSYTLSTSETIAAGNNSVLSTASSGSSADRYLGAPAINDLTGDVIVHYTSNGTSYTATVAVNLDADGDLVANSNDAYPNTAPTSTSHTVDTANGDPGTAFATFNSSTGTADFRVLKYNSTEGYYQQVYSESIDTANGSVTASYDISGVANGTDFIIETEGPAVVDARGLAYIQDADGDGIADGNDPYPNSALIEDSYLINTTNGTPSSLYAEVGNGTFDITFYEVADDGTRTELENRTVTVSSGNVSVEEFTPANFSDAADGDEYVVAVHGDGDSVTTGIFYDSSDGGGGSGTSGTSVSPLVVLGAVGVVLAIGAFLLLRD